MNRQVIHRPFWALVCLLLFQVQVFASHALLCVHAARASEAPAACHDAMFGWAAHRADRLQQEDFPEPCQKCNLELASAGWAIAAGAAPASVAPIPDCPEGAPEHHFYTLCPDRLLRPPIPVSC